MRFYTQNQEALLSIQEEGSRGVDPPKEQESPPMCEGM